MQVQAIPSGSCGGWTLILHNSVIVVLHHKSRMSEVKDGLKMCNAGTGIRRLYRLQSLRDCFGASMASDLMREVYPSPLVGGEGRGGFLHD